PRGLRARAAQRHHPPGHAGGPGAARSRQRRAGGGGGLRLARDWPLRLRAGDRFRLHDGDGYYHLRRSAGGGGQPAGRRALRRPRSPGELLVIGPGAVTEAARIDPVHAAASVPTSQSYWSESWLRRGESRVAMFAGAVVLLMAVVAVTAPLLSHFVTHLTFSAQDLDNNFAGPGTPGHWLGTDELGRDTLTRLAYGPQASLGVPFLTVLLPLTLRPP